MTGGRCSRRRKVVDVGIDIPTDGNSEGGSLDLFTQARKALSDRSPFDLEDGQEVLTGNLPRELATVLCKRSDGRKRHKKSHSATGESKSQRLEKSRGAAFWAGKEVYFRGLTVADIDKLCELSTLDFTETSDCLLIPFVENDRTGTCSAVINGNVSASGNELGNVPEVQGKCDEQFMEVDSAGSVELNVEDKDSGFKQQTSGLEWLLGSRSKIYLTSERPSKKRKLLGGDAGLEKLIVSSAVEDSSSFCHYCGLDTVDQLNRLIVCSMCKMAVHQRCYGVQEEVSESWLCSWCMNRNQKGNSERPCLLCPKQGGALKPVLRSDSSGSMEFAHLFCCQWMPELYIEDTRKMEPIVNFEGIKETRHKLICRLCKIRCGACVRCSNGTCRASFHPICAREARQRMEIWGKFGSDDVELRAFCSKHSEDLNNISIVQGDQFPDQTIAKHQPVSSTMIKPHKLKISRRNGEVEGHFGTSELHLEKADCSVPHEGVLPDARSNLTNELECRGIQQSNTALVLDKSSEDVDTTESSNFKTILKKLIDQGKVSVNDVASDIGVSPEFLSSNLIGDNIVPELRSKIVEWMKNHAFIGPLQRNLKVRFKNLTKVEAVANGDTDGIVSDSCTPDVSVTSIPPRRRTKSDIRILKDGKALCVTRTSSIEDGTSMTHKSACHIIRDEPACQSEESVPDNSLKTLLEPAGSRDILQSNSSKIEGEGSKLSYCTASDSVRAVEGAIPEKNAALDSVSANPVYDTAVNCVPDLINEQSVCSFHMHPTIRKTLSEMPNPAVIRFLTDDNDGLRDRELSPLEASSSSSICCNHQSDKLASPGSVYKFRPGLEQLAKAGRMGILEHSPADEVEGELIFYQQQLLHNALAKKRFSDNLMSKILTNLPEEIDALGKQKWDAVTANKFLYELKEVKKQGRKERRHKEAQAVLAAATAAAAASSRISSFRKDSREESAHQDINPLKADFYSGGAGLYSQQMPRAKETLSRLGTTRVSSEKNYDAVYTNSDFSKDHPRTCEICRRSETILNPILICTSCKVAVHLDCYRCVKDSGGPWYCELCEELSSRSCGALAVNSWEKPYFLAECGFCNGTAGAFRKSTDGQWIHAFCAEWVLESTYKRGQANPVKGMETVIKGSEMCHICRRKQGVCIKCNYGHCQNSFHPSCARSAGFQMNLKTVGSKLQHKAYCEKHSLVERAKAETQKHGMEELKILKPVRVELEKLRLLCERIIRREKLKRDLVLCSHEVLDSNREAASLSALACVSFYQTDVSSESATTLLKSYTDGCKSGNEAIQKSDDITVDSTVAGKSRTKFHVPVDNDQKTDDSSTSQQPCPSKPSDGASFSGKQIPSRPSVPSWSFPSDVENFANYRKYTETFEKELVMTSDQASMKNQRLPKGLVYVPIHCLSDEKEAVPDACSTQEQLKSDE